MGIGKRLKEARLDRGYTQAELAGRIGVTYGAIGNYENETSHPRDTILYALINELGVDANFLFQDVMKKILPDVLSPRALRVGRAYEKAAPSVRKTVEVALEPWMSVAAFAHAAAEDTRDMPVYDMPAAAGLGNYLDSSAYATAAYPVKDIPPKADICVRISGDSMEPEISDGCVVFVETKPVIEHRQIGIFVLNNNSFCKRLVIDHGMNQVRLESDNPAYGPIVIGEDDELRTVGRVLGAAG